MTHAFNRDELYSTSYDLYPYYKVLLHSLAEVLGWLKTSSIKNPAVCHVININNISFLLPLFAVDTIECINMAFVKKRISIISVLNVID